MLNLSNEEKLEVMKSAGYDPTAAHKALNIGVWFYETKEEAEEDGENIDSGTLNGRTIYFLDTTLAY